MNIVISIGRRDVYTTDGCFDTSLYEIQVEANGEYIQDLQLEGAAELLTLRNTLSEYIERNNLTPTDNNAELQ